jgi:hypothetical protein
VLHSFIGNSTCTISTNGRERQDGACAKFTARGQLEYVDFFSSGRSKISTVARSRSLQFCRALYQEIGDVAQRWTAITAVADRLGIDQDKAEALAAELDKQGLETDAPARIASSQAPKTSRWAPVRKILPSRSIAQPLLTLPIGTMR